MISAVEMSRQLQKQQIETAREISRSLSGLYRKINPAPIDDLSSRLARQLDKTLNCRRAAKTGGEIKMQYRNIPWAKYNVQEMLQHPNGTLLLCRSGRVRLPYLCELSGNFPDDREVMVLNRSLRKYENLSRKRNVEYYVLPEE